MLICHIYERESICNGNVPINLIVLYWQALYLDSREGLLLGYTITLTKLFSNFILAVSRKGTKVHYNINSNSRAKQNFSDNK